MSDQFQTVIDRVKALTQKQIASEAKHENAKIMETAPRPLTMVRHVDGTKGAPEESVKPGGVIVYDYGRLDQVADFALDTLRQLSPVRSGAYARSHVLMINGQVVDNLKGWKPGDKVSISNPLPYTRKIEVGRAGFKAHAHVYEKAERIVSRRFGNQAAVFFAYERAPPGTVHTWAGTTKLSHRGHASTATRSEWLTRQPTLIIREIR